MIEFMLELSSPWVHSQTGFNLSEQYYLDPVYRLNQDRLAAAWALERYPNIDVYIESGEFAASQPPAIRVGGLQPYLIISTLFGASIRYWDDREPAIFEEPIKGVPSLHDIKVPAITEQSFIRFLLEQLDQMHAQFGQQMTIQPPFFWDDSGWAFVHAPFTTAYKLRGEEFFIELHTNPEGIRHLIDVVTQTIIRLIDLFAFEAGIEVRGIHLGDCAATLVSAQHYRQFAIPALQCLLNKYGPGRLHSCGPSTHLLSAFQVIEGVEQFQLGWDTDLCAARQHLGSAPIAYLVPPAFLFQEPEAITGFMQNAFQTNEDAPLLWWLTIDRGTPEENLMIAHRFWLDWDGRKS